MGVIKKPKLTAMIAVSEIGDFGVKVDNVWWGADPMTVVDGLQVGKCYEVVYRWSEPSTINPAGDKHIITEILREVPPVERRSGAAIVPPPVASRTAALVSAPVMSEREAEARGKSRFGHYNAALMSPSIAGLQLDTMEKILEAVRKAADDGMKYTFREP